MTCIEIAQAAGLKRGRQAGAESPFHCPGAGHADGDQHASLLINPKKNKWMCGPCGGKGTAWQLAAFLGGVLPSDKTAVIAWLRERGLATKSDRKPSATDKGRIVATYPYVDETGILLYEVIRYEPKDFSQRRPDGKGGHLWSLDGVRRVLYRLHDVLQAEMVYIVEGEKDADNLRTIGLTATCNPGGAGKWRPEFSECFRRHQRIAVIPDNDEPGRKHAQKVAESLAGKVASVKILELDGLPSKGDVSDWLAAAGTREQLEALAAAVPEWKPSASDGATMRFTRLGDLLNEPEEQVRWLVEDHLPMGGDSLLVAKPKVGKSTLARCLALAVAQGESFLGISTSPGTVFYLALEEKRSEVRRHFAAMGARVDDPILIFCAPSPADGLAQLRAAAEKQNPVLIIVDPLFRFTRVKDGNDYAAVTTAMEPLHTLARETGAHVMAAHHAGKGDRQGGDSVLGSTALFAAVDTLLIMKRNDRFRTISTIQRYGVDLDEITLEYDKDTGAVSAGLARVEADQNEAEEAILQFLATQTEPVDEGKIQESVEGRKGVKAKALRRAVEAQKIRRSGTGKKGDPYLYQNSGFLVPNIYREPEKPESRNRVTHSNDDSNAGSRVLTPIQPISETREPAICNVDREEFDL